MRSLGMFYCACLEEIFKLFVLQKLSCVEMGDFSPSTLCDILFFITSQIARRKILEFPFEHPITAERQEPK